MVMDFTVVFSCTLFLLSILLLFSKLNYDKHKLPPGPILLPFIGNLHTILGGLPTHRSFYKLSGKHGPLMYLKLGNRPTIVASYADTAREFLKTHDIACCSRPILPSLEKITYGFSDIGFSPYGDHWRELKKISILQLFSSKKVALSQYVREEEVDRMIASISSASSEVNLSEELPTLVLNITCRGLLGLGYSSQKRLLQILPEARAVDTLNAGADTSAITIEWAMSELMRNPGSMKKAQQEVRSLLGQKAKVEETDLHQLHYLKAVVKETMRLHPPGPLIRRETMQHCKVNDYDIPAKTLLFINVFAIGRDADVWEMPNEFCPERFLNSCIDYKGCDFQLIPFGAGRRICPAINFAVLVVELTLANLLYLYDWKLPMGMTKEDIDMGESPGLTVHAKSDLRLVAMKYVRAN